MLTAIDMIKTPARVSTRIADTLWISWGSYTMSPAIRGVIGDGCEADTLILPISMRLVLTSVATWIDDMACPALIDMKDIEKPIPQMVLNGLEPRFSEASSYDLGILWREASTGLTVYGILLTVYVARR